MARHAVLVCDSCGEYSNVDNPVIKTSVTGPRFDVCRGCRTGMLMSLDIPREKALAYHLLMEKQGDKRGARPTLASLGEAPAVEPQAEPELAMELEATPEEPPAAKRGGKVKA